MHAPGSGVGCTASPSAGRGLEVRERVGQGREGICKTPKGLAVKELVWGGIRVAAWRRWLSLVEKQGADTGQQRPETVKLEPAAFPGQRAGGPSLNPSSVCEEGEACGEPAERRAGGDKAQRTTLGGHCLISPAY